MGDAFAPDVGQQIDAQGRITYDFDGHVHAQGLDLDAGTSDTPPADRRVRWLRTTDGSLVADLFGYAVDADHAGAQLEAQSPSGGFAQLHVNAGTFGGQDRVDAVAGSATGGHTATIVDADGGSNFPQLPAVSKATIYGPYSTGPLAIAAGADSVVSLNLPAAINQADPAKLIVSGAIVASSIGFYNQLTVGLLRYVPPSTQLDVAVHNFGAGASGTVAYTFSILVFV